MSITTRIDVITAKQLLDNLDQINAALATLANTNGTLVVPVPPKSSITFLVSDLVAFLTSVHDKHVTALTSYGITSL